MRIEGVIEVKDERKYIFGWLPGNRLVNELSCYSRMRFRHQFALFHRKHRRILMRKHCFSSKLAILVTRTCLYNYVERIAMFSRQSFIMENGVHNEATCRTFGTLRCLSK